MKTRMLRVPTFIHHVQGRLMTLEDRNQRRGRVMALTKVAAKSALSVLQMFHSSLLLLDLNPQLQKLLPNIGLHFLCHSSPGRNSL